MATDALTDIADAIVSFIPTLTFADLALNAERIKRTWLGEVDVKDIRHAPFCSVVPMAAEITTSSRATADEVVQVNVHIQQVMLETDDAAVDRFRVMMNEILDGLTFQKQAGHSWQRIENEPVVSFETLQTLQVMASNLRVYYHRTVTRR